MSSLLPNAHLYPGGCHCGAIRFEVKLVDPKPLECNCSICVQKGFLHLIVEPEDFVLLQGAESLSTYRFGTKTAIHRFCKRCGIHPFYTPRSHPDKVDVNAHCLDGAVSEGWPRESFDGRNWEYAIKDLRK